MRVILTGATGFIGSHVLRQLLAEGHEVAALMREGSDPWRVADLRGEFRRVEGDLARPEAAEASIREFRPEAVAHLAWSGVGNAHRDDPAQVGNIDASVRLLEVARRAGAVRLVGLGSQAEYGPHPEPIAEDMPTRPTTLYGIAKLSTFLLLGHLCRLSGISFAWLRVFSTYGPKDDPAWMIPYLARTLLEGGRPSLTKGEQLWDYLFVEDAARAVCRVVDSAAGGAFNLGSGRAEPLRSIVERVRDLIDPGLPLGFGEVPYRPDQVMRLQADVRRLGEATGWSPVVGLDEGLGRTVGWFRDHPGGRDDG